MNIYFYKLTSDDGGAPCVRDGLLSLAICKPMIRSSARPGDLIFGFAADSLHRDNRLIYIASVTDKANGADYYDGDRFEGRGDRIYRRSAGRFHWRRTALYHGPEDLAHDLGEHPNYARAKVLLSTDYRYFGADGSDSYKDDYAQIKEAIEHLGRGHRVDLGAELSAQLLALKERLWRKTGKEDVGKPASAPRRGISHRSRSCGVLRDVGQ